MGWDSVCTGVNTDALIACGRPVYSRRMGGGALRKTLGEVEEVVGILGDGKDFGVSS